MTELEDDLQGGLGARVSFSLAHGELLQEGVTKNETIIIPIWSKQSPQRRLIRTEL